MIISLENFNTLSKIYIIYFAKSFKENNIYLLQTLVLYRKKSGIRKTKY